MKAKLFMLVVSIGLLITSCQTQEEKNIDMIERAAKEFFDSIREKEMIRLRMITCGKFKEAIEHWAQTDAVSLNTTVKFHKIEKISDTEYIYHYADSISTFESSPTMFQLHFKREPGHPLSDFLVYNSWWLVDWSRNRFYQYHQLAEKIGVKEEPDRCDVDYAISVKAAAKFAKYSEEAYILSLRKGMKDIDWFGSFGVVNGSFLITNTLPMTIKIDKYRLDFYTDDREFLYSNEFYDGQILSPGSTVMVKFLAPHHNNAGKIAIVPIIDDMEDYILEYDSYEGYEYRAIRHILKDYSLTD